MRRHKLFRKDVSRLVMSYFWTGMLLLSLIFSLVSGQSSALSSAALEGAQAGCTLALSIGGAICLWSGVGRVMEKSGLNQRISRLLMPLMGRLFPSAREDAAAASFLSANICANLLGLGNAATPMGVAAAKRLARHAPPGKASDEMCRLIVMNTASIQLIPANVAAVRGSLGSAAPFDILPAVWVTSILSVSVGLLAAWMMGRLRRD